MATATAAATGPRTGEGKATSSRNALRHGLTATQVILPGEDPAEYDELRQYLFDSHQPAQGLETILVDQITQCTWRLNRARHLEREALEQDLTDPNAEVSHRVEKITRYMASIERAFHRAVRELASLQAKRATERKTAAQEKSVNMDQAIRNYIFAPVPSPKTEITKRTPAPAPAAPAKPSLRSQMPANLALCL